MLTAVLGSLKKSEKLMTGHHKQFLLMLLYWQNAPDFNPQNGNHALTQNQNNLLIF